MPTDAPQVRLLQDAIRLLEEHGYCVTKPHETIQKNIEIDKPLWEKVDQVMEAHHMRIRECVQEALEIWLAHKSSQNGGMSDHES